jgi:hypothetical protein
MLPWTIQNWYYIGQAVGETLLKRAHLYDESEEVIFCGEFNGRLHVSVIVINSVSMKSCKGG